MVSSPRVLLVYPVRDDFEPSRGILNKMRYQADALRSLGFDLTTVVGREEGVVLDGRRVLRYRWTGGRPKRVFNHYAAFWKLDGLRTMDDSKSPRIGRPPRRSGA